jgi:hypothetical protein
MEQVRAIFTSKINVVNVTAWGRSDMLRHTKIKTRGDLVLSDIIRQGVPAADQVVRMAHDYGKYKLPIYYNLM